ncbi:MAG: DNA polymerase III subunit beta [Patescibacteria group bacterium]|jgi:DNA polymerase-3 subunit beta
MKATILQSHFAKGLNQVYRIVGTRTTLPVLGNILISAKKGRISFSATDLEVGVTTTVTGKIEEEGDVTVPARLISDFISNNSDDTITIESDETTLKASSARYNAKIAGISAEEFPTIPSKPKDSLCSFGRDVFVDTVKKIIIAPAHDETRPTIAGIYFQFSGKSLTLAATDSYRLAEKKIALDKDVPETKIIIPSRTMAEVLRLAGSEGKEDIEIAVTENQVFFIFGESWLVSRVIEGSFPNYSQIIPGSFKVSATVDHKELVSAIKMTALFAKDAANNIKMKVDGDKLVASSALVESGNATSQMPAKVSGEGIEISFNAKYLLDALQVVSPAPVTIKLNDGNSAGMLEFGDDKDYLYIVMPLKIE